MSTDLSSKQALAFQQLKSAHHNRVPIEPIRHIIGDTDIESAYAVQSLWVEHMIQEGARKVGVKIGLTSEAVQKQLGVDQPDFGILFAHTQLPHGGSIPFDFLMQAKVEAEMAFVLSDDIQAVPVDNQELLSYISHVFPALEVVGSRVAHWDIKITDTIADNASASHFVLGVEGIAPEYVDFENAQMQLFRNGALSSQGNAKACMGNPLNAVRWLVETFLMKGVAMNKGDIILSGALGPMVTCAAGDTYEAQIEGLGRVHFNITP